MTTLPLSKDSYLLNQIAASNPYGVDPDLPAYAKVVWCDQFKTLEFQVFQPGLGCLATGFVNSGGVQLD